MFTASRHLTQIGIIVSCIGLMPGLSGAANLVKQFGQTSGAASPRTACKSPTFGFSPGEIEKCVLVYQSCMHPDMKQYERDLCVVEKVRSQQKIDGGNGGQDRNPKPPRQSRMLNFTFDSFQAYDLIEMCEERQNRKRPLCTGAILPNKPKIIRDINQARQ